MDVERDNVEEPERGVDYGDAYLHGNTTILLMARNLLAAAGELISCHLSEITT